MLLKVRFGGDCFVLLDINVLDVRILSSSGRPAEIFKCTMFYYFLSLHSKLSENKNRQLTLL